MERKVRVTMRFKWVKAMLLAASVMVSSLYVPVANAETQSSSATQEYIVLAKNDVGYDKIEDNFDVNEELSEGLEDDNIVVASMTAREAKRLEKDKNILLVEEDITLEGSDYEEAGECDLDIETQHALKLQIKEARANQEGVNPEDQWNVDMIGASDGEYSEASDTVRVAVIDSGVLASADIDVKERVNFVGDEAEVLFEDISGHGTSVAGVIAAKDDGQGITGVNPNTELYSLRVLDNQKKAPLSRIVNSIYWCIDHNIDIINMSFGTTVRSEILENAIKDADRSGILMIAAAGNNGETSDIVEYPAAFDEVVAVGGITPGGAVSDISSIGDEVELLAPGESVPANDFFGDIIKADGTSVAAPHVTGVASVLLAKDNTKSPRFIRELMKVSSKSIDDNDYGVVDLDYALSVYDDFAASYSEDYTNFDNIVAENTNTVDSYDEAEVEALWYKKDHYNAINDSNDISANVKKVFRLAQKYADEKPYLKGGTAEQDIFHGNYNYVANYMYLMNLARKRYHSSDMETAIAATSYAYYPNNSKSIIDNRMRILENDFSSIFGSDVVDTKENRGRFVAGLAVHILMDTYAHEAYEQLNGVDWTRIPSKKEDKSNPRDNINRIEARYLTAKDAALDAIYVWHYALTPDGQEFYHPYTHGSNDFKLRKFHTFVDQADHTSIVDHPVWYSNRSAE